ncbi:MAG TPA: methyltransferase [Anaerolineae bacterium]|nr:methyltransferase [Anaerolineae bacterium]
MSSANHQPPSPSLLFEITSVVHPAFAFLAAAQLDLFTPLKDGPLGAEALAASLGVSALKLKPLLYALAASNLLKLEGDVFANTEVADYYLVRTSPRYMGGMHELLSYMWKAELLTAETIRRGKPAAKADYDSMAEAELLGALRGLHPGAIAAAYALMKRYDFSAYKTLVDVGGGTGGVTTTLLEKYSHLDATILELPSIVPYTHEFVASSQASDRIKIVATDVVHDPIEGLYDAAILRAFVHVLGPEEARQALKHVAGALRPGGDIYIAGAVLDDSRLSPPGTVAFNLLFLNVYDGGEAYTEQEHRTWLEEAGFENMERVLLPDGNSFVTAQKRDSN